MTPVLLFADRLPPLIGGMEMHAGAFVEHFSGHPWFPLVGVVTRNEAHQDCLVQDGPPELIALPELPQRLRLQPGIIFFNSGRWIEDLADLRQLFPAARFVYRTGGNEILKAPVERLHLADHAARQAWWVARLNAILDQLITNSAYTEARLTHLGVRPELFARCVGGVDNRALREAVASAPERDGPLRLLCVARFVPYKNHDLLLDVMEVLLDEGLEVELRLAGDGPLLEETRRRCQSPPLDGHVRLLGRLENHEVCRELVAADAYIQLSGEHMTEVPGGSYLHAEGMGRAILEALSCGVFVIAPRSGALPEIITPARGLLVDLGPARDIAAQVAAQLEATLPRPEPQDDFGWDSYFARYEALWGRGHAPSADH